MSSKQAEIERQVVAEIGHRQAAGLKANAGSRVCGAVVRRGADWDKAFAHIREHFRPAPAKPSHLLFHKKYRTEEALRRLILTAAARPSEVRLTKLKVHGDHFGKPAVEIVREFGEPVGDDPQQTRLRIFIDCQGNLITAYPGAAKTRT